MLLQIYAGIGLIVGAFYILTGKMYEIAYISINDQDDIWDKILYFIIYFGVGVGYVLFWPFYVAYLIRNSFMK